MKRLIVSIFAVAAFTGASWGQMQFPSSEIVFSLENLSTAGLSSNEIDKSFTAGDGFGSVGNPFLLAGVLGNPGLLTNFGSGSSFDLGYYKNGALPYSAYGSFSAANFVIAINNDSSVESTASKPVTSGITVTNTNWVTQVVDTKYALPSALSTLSGTFQGLFSISGITTGLVFALAPDWSSTNGDSAFYATTTTTHNYDTAAATPTIAAVQALDYTTTVTAKNINTAALPGTGASGPDSIISDYRFTAPFFMKTGSLEHFAYLSLRLQGTDSSGSYSTLTTASANNSLAGITDQTIDITSAINKTGIDAAYSLSMPGFFGAAAGNEFSAGIEVADTITNGKYSYDNVSKVYTTPAANTKTGASGTEISRVDTFSAVNYLKLAAMAQHSVNFMNTQDAFFSIAPQFIASYYMDPNKAVTTAIGAPLSQSVTFTHNLNASFADSGAAYTRNTTVYTGKAPSRSQLGLGLNLPTAFKYKPEGWFFGFFTGATPWVSFAWTTNTTTAQTSVLTADTITAGAVTATTITTTVSSPTSTTAFATTFGEDHRFGIYVPFQGGVRADILLNGNLLALESFTMQLYVPLK